MAELSYVNSIEAGDYRVVVGGLQDILCVLDLSVVSDNLLKEFRQPPLNLMNKGLVPRKVLRIAQRDKCPQLLVLLWQDLLSEAG